MSERWRFVASGSGCLPSLTFHRMRPLTTQAIFLVLASTGFVGIGGHDKTHGEIRPETFKFVTLFDIFIKFWFSRDFSRMSPVYLHVVLRIYVNIFSYPLTNVNPHRWPPDVRLLRHRIQVQHGWRIRLLRDRRAAGKCVTKWSLIHDRFQWENIRIDNKISLFNLYS